MINVKEQSITIRLDEKGSSVLTQALSCLIEFKKNNICTKNDCVDCFQQKTKMRETDTEKLANEIMDLYFDMYKISMSTTKIPTLQEIRDSIINPHHS